MAVDESVHSVPVAEPPAQGDVQQHGGDTMHGSGHDIHLPPESLWPITLAFAITVAAIGLVTNLLVTIPGVVMFAVALRGWAQELLDAQQH
jgi:hypothetical protein